MDTLSEDFMRADIDTQMTVLASEDIMKQEPDISDEVEDLQNSLRQAVHDETVRPKMQCLMMDPSFSMVTMQGEDSGIEWETSPSRCTTPWASEIGNPPSEFSSRPATPGSLPAGRIIIVMDEENISRRKRTKERASALKIKKQQRELLGDPGEVFGRPELVGVSLPNVKHEGEEDKGELKNTTVDEEQQLFCLVAEGSEILNIVVPPKLAMVDEEESTAMVDNLSYLEESPVIKSMQETDDNVFELNNGMAISIHPVTGSNANEADRVASYPCRPNVMDPPGAPAIRPQVGSATSNVDYFEKFTLIDAQAPGSPAVTKEEQEEPPTEGTAGEIQDKGEPKRPEGTRQNWTANEGDEGTPAALSGEELTSDLLDDVFYGSTDDGLIQGSSDRGECKLASKVPLKQSGSALFGSQEDILTPIFLPGGPPKIIDPILLEEPTAMAFLYTDLYEEATGSRIKEEDAESVTSEKSFHSRHSDREARGYLEKYVLKDETPALETEETTEQENIHDEAEGIRVLSQELCSFGDSPSNPEMCDSEEEITDFFRASADSSPCDMEPFRPTALTDEEGDPQATTKNKSKAMKEVAKATGKEKDKIKQMSFERYDFLSEDTVWGSVSENAFASNTAHHSVPITKELGMGMETPAKEKPVAPPRRKTATAPKTSLELTPLLPVEAIEGGEAAGVKEQREEEKESASPAETADEGEGEGEGSESPPSGALSQRGVIVETNDNPRRTVKDRDDDSDAVGGETMPTLDKDKHTASALIDITPAESPKIESKGDREGKDGARASEPAKEKGQCIIL